jgi:predicted DsbA family dithiol-disulfide isomerase
MAVRIDVWSDFVCPWCFLVTISLKELSENFDTEIVRHAYELRPFGSPPMPQEYRDYIDNVGHPRMVEMAREYYGVEIFAGPTGIDSRKALIGAKYAESKGKGPEYHDAVYRAYWQEGRSIDDIDVLAEIAQKLGMDGAAFRAALDSRELNVLVNVDIDQARRYGITGVPALVFNNKYLVSGAQPYDVLKDVVKQIEAEDGAASV